MERVTETIIMSFVVLCFILSFICLFVEITKIKERMSIIEKRVDIVEVKIDEMLGECEHEIQMQDNDKLFG